MNGAAQVVVSDLKRSTGFHVTAIISEKVWDRLFCFSLNSCTYLYFSFASWFVHTPPPEQHPMWFLWTLGFVSC